MPRRQGYALFIALVAGTAVLAAAVAFGTSYLTGTRHAPLGRGVAHPAAHHPAAPATSTGTWVATWTGAPVSGEPHTEHGFPGRTIRNTVHTSIGGHAARITLSNLFGTVPLVIDRATVAARPVTFRGAPAVSVPAGRQVVSDPVAVVVPADADLQVALRTPRPGGPVTYHPNSHQTSYLATQPTTSWRYLTAVDVRTDSKAAATVVVLGDSLTAGTGSTTDANSRWPDVLSDRLRHRYGIANQGIAGNRLLRDGTRPGGSPSGISRYERDVLSVAGAKTVIIALGINDVQQAPQERDPQRIVNGLRTLTAEAHARGMRVVGATLMPFRGYATWTPRREAVRRAVNERIREGGVFDAVLDFDRAVRDPYAPDRLLPAYDCGDRLHLNDNGYRMLGRSIDLRSLTGAPAYAF